jgi:hypothetical protein
MNAILTSRTVTINCSLDEAGVTRGNESRSQSDSGSFLGGHPKFSLPVPVASPRSECSKLIEEFNQMAYGLNITIDAKDVENLNGHGHRITVVKSEFSGTGPKPVAWLTWKPGMSNIVSWEETYWIYTTNTDLQAGATIHVSSQTSESAKPTRLYTFKNNVITWDGTMGPEDSFNLKNLSGAWWTCGLSQKANVNGTPVFSPLCAVSVGNNETASFIPKVKVSIFLTNYTDNGVVISAVSSDALTVELTSAAPTANIGFDGTNNTFYLMGLMGAAIASPSDLARRLMLVSA